MITKIKETNEIIKDKNIDEASNNFKNISSKVKNQKFEHIDTWLLKTSKHFKTENSILQKALYPRFEYGTIVKVDFGINVGSELSGPHFAIVLDKFDSTKSNSITVLPLTSQKKKHNLELNTLIIEEFTKRLTKALNVLKIEINEILISKKDLISETTKKQEEVKLLQDIINYYSNYEKISYASLNQITTISKNKIMRPKNKYDIVGRAKCNSKTMQIISKEIIKKYTNIKLYDTQNNEKKD